MRHPWWDLGARVLVAVLGAAALVAGCGGGVGEGGTGNGYTQGAISGFGSIFVNDLRFDDGSASVQDADGNPRSVDDLRLGMTVEVESGAIDSASASATAAHIRFGSELLGPVATVDSANNAFTMLGQTVLVAANTVFDDTLAGGLPALAAGQFVEVYASFDPGSGRYRATRIERPASQPAAFRLRGIVAGLDGGNRRFTIGAAQFDYSAAGSAPVGLANGAYVRLTLAAAGAGSSRWSVTAFAAGTSPLPDSSDANLRGFITAFSSTASFSVNGQAVDAGRASFPDGKALALGTKVEIVGPVRGGVVQASQVQIRSESQDEQQEFQLIGSITSVDTAGQTFLLRGVIVSFAGNPRVDNGVLADLKPARNVEVRGSLSADGTRLDATRITFKN